MKKNNLKLLSGMLVALGIALALTLSACGGGSSAPAETDATQEATSADASGEYTLVEDGKLTMISNFYFPPFVSMNNEKSGQEVFEGFDVDVLREVASRLGLEANILPTVQFDTIVPTIKQGGKADVSLGGITITDERLKEIDFSDPYVDSNQAIVVKKDAEATTAEQLNVAGTQIAVQSGTTGEAWARENCPNATIVPLDDIIQCLTGLSTGLYQASVCDLPVAEYEIQIAYSDLMVPEGGAIPTGEQYGIVVSKDNPALTEAINQALADMEADGTLDEIETKWFGSPL